MKNKSTRYLSNRVFWMFSVLFAFLLITHAVFTVIAVREGRHLIFVAGGYLSLGAAAYVFYRWIYQPYLESAKVTQLFLTGYTIHALFDQRVLLSPEIEEITKKVQEIMNTDKLVNATKKQAQYLALQNQINPHFLYNTLESIRSEALISGLGSVAEMCEPTSYAGNCGFGRQAASAYLLDQTPDMAPSGDHVGAQHAAMIRPYAIPQKGHAVHCSHDECLRIEN